MQILCKYNCASASVKIHLVLRNIPRDVPGPLEKLVHELMRKTASLKNRKTFLSHEISMKLYICDF